MRAGVFFALMTISAASGLGRVIDMLNKMKQEQKDALHEEQKIFQNKVSSFEIRFTELKSSKKFTAEKIMETSADKEMASSNIQANKADVAKYNQELAEIEKSTAENEAMKKDVEGKKAKSTANWLASKQAIDMVLTKIQGNPALIQNQALAKSLILMQAPGVAAAEADNYQSTSGNIVDLCNKLLDNWYTGYLAFQNQCKDQLRTIGENLASLREQKKSKEREISVTKKALGEAQSQFSTSSALLNKQQKIKGDLQATIEKTSHEAMTQTAEFQQLAEDLKNEIAAVEKAVEVLTQVQSPTLAQVGHSFVQTKVASRYAFLSKIEGLSKNLSSRSLSLLADKVAFAMRVNNGADVFGKIKGMIEEMIAKLQTTLNAETDKHAYCTKEIGETKSSMQNLQDELDTAQGQRDSWEADGKKNRAEAKQLRKDLADIEATRADASKTREEENAMFSSQHAVVKSDLSALDSAISTLTDYAGSEGHGRLHGDSTSKFAVIIQMIQNISDQMMQKKRDMQKTEEENQSAYDTLIQELAIEHTDKTARANAAENEAARCDARMTELAGDIEKKNEEMGALKEYRNTLNTECSATTLSFEERAARKKAEIEGLKQALNILETETA